MSISPDNCQKNRHKIREEFSVRITKFEDKIEEKIDKNADYNSKNFEKLFEKLESISTDLAVNNTNTMNLEKKINDKHSIYVKIIGAIWGVILAIVGYGFWLNYEISQMPEKSLSLFEKKYDIEVIKKVKIKKSNN